MVELEKISLPLTKDDFTKIKLEEVLYLAKIGMAQHGGEGIGWHLGTFYKIESGWLHFSSDSGASFPYKEKDFKELYEIKGTGKIWEVIPKG